MKPTIILLLLEFLYISQAEINLRATGELRKACSKRGAVKQPPSRVNTTARIKMLREVMRTETAILDRAIDAYIITSDDEHQTEYVAPYDRRREYISGFSGSAGDAIVTQNAAALWTDGRYHLQADDQLNCDWLLMRDNQNKAEWLKKQLPNGGRIGADPKLISQHLWTLLEEDLQNSTLKLVPIARNLIDLIWENHTDTITDKNAFVRKIEFAGKSWGEKVEETRKELKEMRADAMVVTSLAEIAWLLNIRGRDIPYNPFVRSYVIITMDAVRLYIDKNKLKANNVNEYLHTDWGINSYSVIVRDYDAIWDDIRDLAQTWRFVLLPSMSSYSSGVSRAIYATLNEEKIIYKPSPIILLKAKKNEVEIAGMERAHIRDGAAMCEFLQYLESKFEDGEEIWTELDAVKVVNEIRFEQNLSLGNSFETIVAFGMNAALPHYQPTMVTNAVIFNNSTVVIDSGGQYYDGTTDVTRTLHFGTPTEAQINAYTRVLMGSIQLSSLIFPEKLKISSVDVFARAYLWEVGLDYMHGTGHGIGSFLGVHEPPIAVHYNSHNKQTFHPGYFFSNEPGYYSEGEFGIRLENILEVISLPWFKHISGQAFLGFKDVTLVPYEPKLINTSLLSASQKKWLNNYNTRIRELVGRELKARNKMKAFYWMMDKTKHIPGKGNLVTSRVYIIIVSSIFYKFL